MPRCNDCCAPAGRGDRYCAQCGSPLPDERGGSGSTEPDPSAPKRSAEETAAGRESTPTDPRDHAENRRPPVGRGADSYGGSTPARASGLRIICAVIAILGVQTAIGSIALFQAQSVLGPGVGGGGYGAIGGLLVALGGAYLVAAYGLWTGTGWAWSVTLGVLVVGAVIQLAAPLGPGVPVLSALTSGGLAAYLWAAGERFRPARRPNAATHS